MKPIKQVKEDENAMYAFNMIKKFLTEQDVIDDVDHMVVNMAAINFGLYMKYVNDVASGDIIQIHTKSGYEQIKPQYSIWQKAGETFDKCIKQLGLSPWARNNLKDIFEKKKDPSKKLDNKFFTDSKKTKRPDAQA